jgi:hypothetical protein
MPNTKFLCWETNNETEDDADEVVEFNSEWAASEYAEAYYQNVGEHMDTIHVSVKHPDGTIYRYHVLVEFEPTFTPYPVLKEGST